LDLFQMHPHRLLATRSPEMVESGAQSLGRRPTVFSGW